MSTYTDKKLVLDDFSLCHNKSKNNEMQTIVMQKILIQCPQIKPIQIKYMIFPRIGTHNFYCDQNVRWHCFVCVFLVDKNTHFYGKFHTLQSAVELES